MNEPTVAWKVRLKATLAARVELFLMNAALRKPQYGSRKQLMEYLLERWLKEQSEGESNHG